MKIILKELRVEGMEFYQPEVAWQAADLGNNLQNSPISTEDDIWVYCVVV